jgi:hypothetical protein
VLYIVVGLILVILFVLFLAGILKTGENAVEIFSGRQKPRIVAALIVALVLAAVAFWPA